LIITNKDDAHADAVIELGHALGPELGFVRLNTEDLFTGVEFEITESHFLLQTLDAGKVCSSANISGAWYRRPVDPNIPSTIPNGQSRFLRNEGWEVIQGLFGVCREKPCLPGPDFAVSPRNKIRQLYIAHQLGFNVPKSLVSNQYPSLISFAEAVHICVVKTLRWPSITERGLIFPLYARTLDAEQLRDSHANYDLGVPVFLQEGISKQFDVRLTVVYDEVFAVGMVTDNTHSIDVREIEPSQVTFFPVEPPPDIICKSKLLMKLDRLDYSALDFVVDKSGCWWFLENNPNGQFYWLQRATGLPIREAIFSRLTSISKRNQVQAS